MVVDYSKWDKIELSDDSDIEVHPNVDKNSFIRWKQQSIHEERIKRDQDIKNLEAQTTMYSNLNKRVDKILKNYELININEIDKYLNENFDKNERQIGDNVDPDIPTFNEMVEDLFEQLQNDAKKQNLNSNDKDIIKNLLLNHRSKISTVTIEAKEKLNELYKAKNSHISSDDIHTGFNSSFLNKKNDDKEDKKNTEIIETIEQKNSFIKKNNNSLLPSSIKENSTPILQFIEYTNEKDLMKLDNRTINFSKISIDKLNESKEFLINNMQILSNQQKDALMMKSFDYQLNSNNKDDKMTYQIIHQSEIMSYLREIYDLQKIPFLQIDKMKEVIEMFFNKVMNNPQGKQSFLESVKQKFNHVKQRSKIIEEETINEQESGEGIETIQLKSLDDSTELEVNLPNFELKGIDENEDKKIEAFNKLPKDMQVAVKTGKLDEVNKVFSKMTVEEAENILEIFDEGEIIGIKALLDDENDFKTLQDEYNSNQQKIEELDINDKQQSTTDIVD